MDAFEYNSNPSRIVFSSGAIQRTPNELEKLGLSKPLIICTPQQTSQANLVKGILSGKIAGIFAEATMHTPVTITEKAVEFAKKIKCDSLISIGGGSTIGLAKAISFRTGLYHLAIPTTYAGSEVTPILGETENGRKITKTDHKILPRTVIYDINLTMTLPIPLSSSSGINAIAHAVEALYAPNGSPIITLLAQEGIKALVEALPAIKKDPQSKEACTKALYGAWLCGTCLGSVGMALHHKLCHTLGGTFNLPHSETHTIILPHALSYNAPNIPSAMASLAKAFPESNGDPVHGLNMLLRTLEVKRDLKSFGMKETDIPRATDVALSNPYWNPREVERAPIQELIHRAWAGEDAVANL